MNGSPKENYGTGSWTAISKPIVHSAGSSQQNIAFSPTTPPLINHGPFSKYAQMGSAFASTNMPKQMFSQHSSSHLAHSRHPYHIDTSNVDDRPIVHFVAGSSQHSFASMAPDSLLVNQELFSKYAQMGSSFTLNDMPNRMLSQHSSSHSAQSRHPYCIDTCNIDNKPIVDSAAGLSQQSFTPLPTRFPFINQGPFSKYAQMGSAFTSRNVPEQLFSQHSSSHPAHSRHPFNICEGTRAAQEILR
jgi:hypothetical protein